MHSANPPAVDENQMLSSHQSMIKISYTVLGRETHDDSKESAQDK